MTAEVCILNTMGVALAADSAVSIGPGGDKIYSSAEKLFNLSESAPVGVMIHGNAAFLGMPWETIIKTYRKERRGKTFRKLVEYREDFLRFVSGNRTMFSAKLQSDYTVYLINTYLLHVREKLRVTLDRRAEAEDGLDESDIAPIVHEVIQKNLDHVISKDKLRGFGPATIDRIRKRYSKHITAAKKGVFAELPIENKTHRLMSQLVVEVLTRNHFSPFLTGVVFAGFGDDEFMPRLYSQQLEIMLQNKIRTVPELDVEISHENTASVIPFAQQEMVQAFMDGIDPTMSAQIRDTTSKLFHGVVDGLIAEVAKHDEKLAASLGRRASKGIEGMLAATHKSWDEQSQDHWRPIVTNVSSLPKDELASMAEALVNLTKFRRRVSQDRETVGGPIDVAIITKGDGFVWVKRKHYFKPELNPRTMSQYNNG